MKARMLPLLLLSLRLGAGDPLPLPEAPIRIAIPDAGAFDSALSGAYRQFLVGDPADGDPVVAAWRKSRVGSKLEDQWGKLSSDLPWTWDQIAQLKPTAVGIALLQIGHLDAVLVVDTPLAKLPLKLPAGKPKTYAGVGYAMVAKGAADGNVDRRMGLAWVRLGSRLILATSEHALKLAIDQAQAQRGFEAPMPGLVSMELDLAALRKDRYFRREFLFPEGPEQGSLRAALRNEGGHLVEVREGTNEPRQGSFSFEVSGYAAVGWEPEGQPFWDTFRRGLLEPVPEPAELPVPALAPLPPAGAKAAEDRYATDFTKPLIAAGGAVSEEGDLRPWKALLAKQPVSSWGFWVTADGVRRMAFAWPAAADADFIEACRATTARRAGRASLVKSGAAQEIRVGPGLPALAFRRTGAVLWVAPSAQDLQDAPTPKAEPDLIRWGRVQLGAVRAEGARWEKLEGPAQPEQVRPLSDRVLGLLGWMPAVSSLSVERRRSAQGWTERVVFGESK